MATNYHPSLRSQSDDSQSPYQGDQNLGFYSELPSYINNITTYNHFSAAGPYSEFFPGSSLSSHSTVEFPSIEARNEMVFIPPTSATMNLETIDGHISTAAGNPVGDSINGDSHTVQMPQLGVLDGEHSFHREGLSLSLGSQMQAAGSVSPLEHHFPSLSSPHLQTTGKWAISCDGYEIKQSKCLSGYVGSDLNTINIDGPHNPKGLVNVYVSSWGAETILKSKYLKAAQQLLDEVVNVKNALKQFESKVSVDTSKDSDGMLGNRSIVPTSTEISLDNGKSVAKSSSELLPAEREDLQNKKTKLLSMLDEVDRRYTQYCRHMRTMVSPFNIVAGRGAAKSYTALARQTISCHFRCLRDAISGQIEVVRRCLGEEDNSPSSQVIIRRLRYVDHKLRQQRALQQLGVTQHAWRPQRGLPESSVSILRAWLFEHFLHLYPNDNEKTMLARQTGLSRNQVANWFINARVRLWKPMVEEMYKEEFGDPESNFKSSPDNATNPHGDNHMASKNKADDYELQDSSTSTAADSFLPGKVHNLKSNHTPDLEVKKPIPSTAFHNTSHEVHVTDSHIMLQYDDKRSNMEDQSLFPDDNYPHDRNADRSLITPSTDMSQLSRFTIGSQVSLALGLQHHESDTIPLPIGTHFRGNNITEAMDYHFMDSIKQQDRFGNSHLLHDFAI